MDAHNIRKFLAGGSGEAITAAADVVWTGVIHERSWMRSVFG